VLSGDASEVINNYLPRSAANGTFDMTMKLPNGHNVQRLQYCSLLCNVSQPCLLVSYIVELEVSGAGL